MILPVMLLLVLPKVATPPAPQGIIAVCQAEESKNEIITVPVCEITDYGFVNCVDYQWPKLVVKGCTEVK